LAGGERKEKERKVVIFSFFPSAFAKWRKKWALVSLHFLLQNPLKDQSSALLGHQKTFEDNNSKTMSCYGTICKHMPKIDICLLKSLDNILILIRQLEFYEASLVGNDQFELRGILLPLCS
jgi:hypothetical protein